MPLYRFRILDASHRVIARQYSYREDDGAARGHAEILAAQTEHPNIEIWSNERQVPRKRSGLLPVATDDRPKPPSNDSPGEIRS